jgi:thiol-disulfide isomerase/thioredoxin
MVILFFCLILCIQSCNNEKIKRPAVRFENEIYNFGEVEKGEILSHTFLFFNPGADTLVLESVRPSCTSCTAIGEYDKKVLPGRTGKIQVTFKTASFRGYVNHKIYVRTNIPDRDNVVLTITGNVAGKAEAPTTLEVIPQPLMFGEINKGDTLLDGKVRIRSFFEKPLLITGIIPPDERTEVIVDVLNEGKEYVINIKVHSPFKRGTNGEVITLKTNLEEWGEIVIPYVYSYNLQKGIKQRIKNKFSNFSLKRIFAFFGRRNNVEGQLKQLEKMEKKAEGIRESLHGKKGAEYVATRDKFYELMHKRANNAIKFLREFSPGDLTKDELIDLLEIAKVAKDEQRIFDISKILFDKFPESKYDLDLIKTFFVNSYLLEPDEVVKYINIDMFPLSEQSWMYYMLAVGFAERGDIEETKNYIKKAEPLYQKVIANEAEKASIPIPYAAVVRALVLEKIGDNKGAYEVISNTAKELSDSNSIKQLEFYARRLNVLGKEALPLETQHWIGTEKTLTLSDLKGKVVLVEFFAWGCELCNLDLPYMFRLHEDIDNDDFVIIGATHYVGKYELERGLSNEQEYQRMRDHYYRVRKIGWPVSMSKVSFPNYGIVGTPDFILIDKRGVVRDGYLIYNYSYLKRKIIELLKES